jgi:uncharacterized protein YyaL (SSP411 family)
MLMSGSPKSNKKETIAWREWSKEAFGDAERKGKLVLLDLSAVWCHWCHVMDQTTYSDPQVVRLVEDNFIPIRVDIDRRPDISERYNRGGFPTTAFLSGRGESIWGATYLPINDMKRIIVSILEANRSGEVGEALERSRMHYLDLSAAREQKNPVTASDLEDVFEDIFATYDVEHGGFGLAPKFPHPDAVELILNKYAENKDDEIKEAVVNTLRRMSEGLYDPVEGGLFRYSVSGDWRTPHYEKMLETNLGYLRNLVHALGVIGETDFEGYARGTAKYLLRTLRDPVTGGFFGSQDADEEYYRLSADERRDRNAPSVDRTIYAGWNLKAASIMITSGEVLGDRDLVNAGVGAWKYAVERLWNPQEHLVRHIEGDDLYLFEDQVALFNAALEMLGITEDDSPVDLCQELVKAVDRAFTNEDGGFSDIMRVDGAVGDLDSPRRPLVENSNWAQWLALFGAATHQEDLAEKARTVLASFTRKDVDASGIFGAAYVSARGVIDLGPLVVEVHSRPGDQDLATKMVQSAKMLLSPSIVVRRINDGQDASPSVTICTMKGCLPRIDDPEKLHDALSSALASR